MVFLAMATEPVTTMHAVDGKDMTTATRWVNVAGRMLRVGLVVHLCWCPVCEVSLAIVAVTLVPVCGMK